jgi:uncharacterized protein (DUF2384 family)
MICKLCQRDVDELTEHHLIPKSTWKRGSIKRKFTKEQMKETVSFCKLCHKNIHKFYTEIQLAEEFYELELLKEDPQVSKFIKWAQKQNRNIK